MINVIGPVNTLGYGYTTLNILKGLSPNVAYWPMGNPQVTTEQDYKTVQGAIKNAEMFDENAPCLRVWHQHDMAQFIGKGLRIGFPIFELDNFSELEKHHLKSVDRLFVCSNWAKEVIVNSVGINTDDVRVVPLGVDLDIFKPAQPSSSKTTVFFNCGKWEIRKGHDILSEVFNEAFTEIDDVELWMMCDNPFLQKEQAEKWKNSYRHLKLGHKVRFINRVETHQEVYNIMSRVDCGVFPARAEGWNLELLELMACGKQVITTNYSAHTEFCNQQNAKLINVDKLEPAYDGVWFDGTKGNWASFDKTTKDNLISHMKAIHEDKQNGRLDTNHNGIKTAQAFTWENTTKEVLNNVR